MSVNLISDICDQVDSLLAYIEKKRPEQLWMYEIQKHYWTDLRDAHKNGKKVVFFGGPGPVELIYAFDAVPFFLDMMPVRISNDVETTSTYIDEAEKYIPAAACGLNKVELGVALRGDYGVHPDCFVHHTVPCDSSRAAHPAMERIFGVPSIRLDVPFRRDERGFNYLAEQYHDFIALMEEVTGNKMDWDRFAEVAEVSNKSNALMYEIAKLRMLKPCPLPGRFLILNEMMMGFGPHPAMAKFMEKQYEVGKAMADKGLGAVKDEKHRIVLLQNMIWSNASILDWFEREYGAVVVMDAFGYQKNYLFDDIYDREEALVTMAKKSMTSPMIHGASGPVDYHIDIINDVMVNYSPDVAMFLGHVGCKHTFATSKLIEDLIMDKYGLPTLTLELDSIDQRYKSIDEVKAGIADYMESVVGAKRISKK